ncbi:MAG: hypothetical protein ABW110_13730 [Steroidobacteraceae bacterium]
MLTLSRAQLEGRFRHALKMRDGHDGAHCIHELWMRGEMGIHIERALTDLWKAAAESIPEWLPTRHIEWLPAAFEAAALFERGRRGRSNVYLILLDYSDSRAEPFGVYVGMSAYPPAARFEQHKAGIRAAGCVLKRGLEVLTGPTLHLQGMQRAVAEGVEARLAEALRLRGIFVQGGH